MKQTAVEWFANRIKHGGLVSKKQFDELLKQANELFKDQIMDTFNYAQIELGMEADEYYNETFKTE